MQNKKDLDLTLHLSSLSWGGQPLLGRCVISYAVKLHCCNHVMCQAELGFGVCGNYMKAAANPIRVVTGLLRSLACQEV